MKGIGTGIATKKGSMKGNRQGAQMPGYLSCSLLALFKEYEAKMVGRPFIDPIGTEVRFLDVNFCKLVQLQRRDPKSGQYVKAKATQVLPTLRNGTFREEDYDWDRSRAQTLLWLPEVIKAPDSIHANTHGIIAGDTVYAKRYAKAGAPHKIAFTHLDQSTRVRVVTTSFWVNDDRLAKFVGSGERWPKQRAAVASGPLLPVTPGPGRRSDFH